MESDDLAAIFGDAVAFDHLDSKYSEVMFQQVAALLQRVRAEAVADERRRIAERIGDMCTYRDRLGNQLPDPHPADHLGPCPYGQVVQRILAAGSVPVATPEPEDSRITNQSGHEFTFTVELRGEGMNWSHAMVPQTVQAWNLSDAIAEIAALPFASWFPASWFPDEADEAATPGPDSVAELAKSCGECTEDGLGSCQHGCRERSSPVATPAKPGTCLQCRHAAHGPVCFNMASDNDCGCAVATPTEPGLGEDDFIDLARRVLAERGIEVARSDVGCIYDELGKRPPATPSEPWCEQHGRAHCSTCIARKVAAASPAPAVQPEER